MIASGSDTVTRSVYQGVAPTANTAAEAQAHFAQAGSSVAHSILMIAYPRHL